MDSVIKVLKKVNEFAKRPYDQSCSHHDDRISQMVFQESTSASMP